MPSLGTSKKTATRRVVLIMLIIEKLTSRDHLTFLRTQRKMNNSPFPFLRNFLGQLNTYFLQSLLIHYFFFLLWAAGFKHSSYTAVFQEIYLSYNKGTSISTDKIQENQLLFFFFFCYILSCSVYIFRTSLISSLVLKKLFP